jgi:hypothetical protein
MLDFFNQSIFQYHITIDILNRSNINHNVISESMNDNP